MYRSQKFKIIKSDATIKNRTRNILLGSWIILVVSLAIQDTDLLREFLWIIGLVLVLIYYIIFFIKGYKKIGELILDKNEIQINIGTKETIRISEIEKIEIYYYGYFGETPSYSVFLNLEMAFFKNGAHNFIKVKTNNLSQQFEFLSSGFSDLDYIKNYIKFLKRIELNAELIIKKSKIQVLN